jgi:predicted dehydrogenase
MTTLCRGVPPRTRSFYRAIASGATPPVGGGDGVKALALADAALESFRTGRVIRI